MGMNEVTIFSCGHKTIWGQISKTAPTRNPRNEVMFCQKCGRCQNVVKTIKQKS